MFVRDDGGPGAAILHDAHHKTDQPTWVATGDNSTGPVRAAAPTAPVRSELECYGE